MKKQLNLFQKEIKMKQKCQRCKHKWDYKGSKIRLLDQYPQYVSCPKCNTSVKLRKVGGNNDK